MKQRVAFLAFTALLATSGAIAAHRWANAGVLDTDHDVRIVATLRGAAMDSVLAAADSAADLIVDNDPFRLANQPASVRYDPATDGAVPGQPVIVAPPIRPALTLKGIVGGPPWQAILDGVPGQPPGTIVRQGDRFDKLAIRSVGREAVIIDGADTTWVLSLRRVP